MTSVEQPVCIVCEQNADQVPLLQFAFKEQGLWICPQHLPILIHKPAQLAGKLPDFAELKPSEGHHHG